MSQIIYTEKAHADMARLVAFMHSVSPQTKDKLIDCLILGIRQLATSPQLGRPAARKGFRELIIPFGRSAYIILYHFNLQTDIVEIARLRHASENGFDD